jgi:hypothetical protein
VTKRGSDLENIEVRNGVNEKGEGFCSIICRTTSGELVPGQLSPAEVRAMALQWLEVAEAAEQDAAVLRLIRKLELPDDLAGLIITELRDGRAQ